MGTYIKWQRIEEGGLGIRPLSQLNEAFLSKLAWKIVSNPSSLLARVFDAKYNRGRGWFSPQTLATKKGEKCTEEAWQGIRRGLRNLKIKVSWVVGDGSKIKLGLDVWVPALPPGYQIAFGVFEN